MDIVCVGGGPGGLYAAILLKQANPSWRVAVHERNPADTTYGWGVVFSQQTLSRLAQADPSSYEALRASVQPWHDLSVHVEGRVHRTTGHDFYAIAYLVDDDGYFVYQARTDDMIITAGYNVAGPEVEAALLAHNAVADCAVIGAPDTQRGTIVKAFVVLRADETADDAMREALQGFVKARIAPYKYPREIAFVQALPRTQTGKIQRYLLRQRAAAR